LIDIVAISANIFNLVGGSNEPKSHFVTLEGWYRIAVEQCDFVLGMTEHSIDARRSDKVPRVNDEVLHRCSIQNEAASAQAVLNQMNGFGNLSPRSLQGSVGPSPAAYLIVAVVVGVGRISKRSVREEDQYTNQTMRSLNGGNATKGAQMNDREPVHALRQSQTARARAEAKITVHSYEVRPFDNETASPALMEIRLNETFSGDIDGESVVRALQVLRDNRSASLVSVQRFRGKLGGRQGTFVLQGSEIVENGQIKATWFVVPRSGTGDLLGLRGEGGFDGQFGKATNGTLEYWFE
jgi:Protein of unknown function (DUF3224)